MQQSVVYTGGRGDGGYPPSEKVVRRGRWLTIPFIKGARTGKERTGWNVSRTLSRKLIAGVFGVTVWWLVTSNIGYVRLS